MYKCYEKGGGYFSHFITNPVQCALMNNFFSTSYHHCDSILTFSMNFCNKDITVKYACIVSVKKKKEEGYFFPCYYKSSQVWTYKQLL